MTPESIILNIHCNWWFLTSQISHSSKKCEIKCPESRKKLTTQYKFSLWVIHKRCPQDFANFLPPSPLVRICPHWTYPSSPRTFGVRNLHPLKEKISTMLLIFCGTLDICQQPLVITYLPSSAVWAMASIRSLPNFLSWLWLTRSLTFLREGDLGGKLRRWCL